MVTLINNIKKIKNPYIIFFPFLLFYFLIVLKSPTQGIYGDERRYLIFAENLIHGYYSTPAPEFNLWNGPGYPIALTPFVFFHLPLICITLFNAILYYLALTLFFKTLQKFFSFKLTLAVSLIWACYINSFGEMKFIYSEILSCFLVSLILYCLVNAFTEERKSKIFAIFAGIAIGYIVLTKVIFGYVLLFILTSMIILWLINRKKLNHRRGLLIAVIALFTISPYLMYTYQLTGKVYYLGNSGGMSLYWMSSPYDNELGDWCHSRNIYQSDVSNSKIDADKKTIPGFTNYLYANHAKDYEQLKKALVDVVGGAGGTGGKAKVSGFTVAGKTGTAQKVDPKSGGYEHGKYIVSFSGFLPAERPEFVGFVVLDEAQTVELLLTLDRSEIQARADARFETMMAEGALQEAQALAGLGIDPSLPAMRAIGVRPLIAAIEGKCSLEEAAAAAKQETRHYVKRQETWFKSHMISWHHINAKYMASNIAEIFAFIQR